MKNGKATGPDNLVVEVWKSLGRTGVDFLKEALMRRRFQTWRKSILVPIFKNTGGILNCGNYRGIKLMYHSMKLLSESARESSEKHCEHLVKNSLDS